MFMRVAFLLSLVCLLGCGGEKDGTMSPGMDCMASGCHTDLTVGGTIYASAEGPLDQGLEGVTVTIVDSAQQTFTLTSNSAGNFYSKDPVVWPADIKVALGAQSGFMIQAPSGACNSGSCHTKNRGLVYLP
jgi:hypothetical protein